MSNRLLTPELIKAFDEFPLYSQEGLIKDAICIAVLAIRDVRWYILEGGEEDGRPIIFGIVVGLFADEYGYSSLDELAAIEVKDCYGSTHRVIHLPGFTRCPLHEIQDERLQRFLAKNERYAKEAEDDDCEAEDEE